MKYLDSSPPVVGSHSSGRVTLTIHSQTYAMKPGAALALAERLTTKAEIAKNKQ